MCDVIAGMLEKAVFYAEYQSIQATGQSGKIFNAIYMPLYSCEMGMRITVIFSVSGQQLLPESLSLGTAVIVPPTNKVMGGYWFHHCCLSVCGKVVSAQYSFSFSHTMMILHTCIDHDPRRTSIDFGVQRSRSYLDFKLFTVSAW